MKEKATDSQSTVHTNARLRVVACCLCAFALGISPASAATYTYTNTNVAGSAPASILDWLPGGPDTQAIWAGGTPKTNDAGTVIAFFQNATTALGNTGVAGNCQTAYVNNAGSVFKLGTLTLQGRASDTPGASLALTLAGDKLSFGTTYSCSFYLNNDGVYNGNQTLTYNINNDIEVGSTTLNQTLNMWNTGPAALTLNGAISDLRAGGGILNKYGFGSVALTGNSSFSGPLNVYDGTIRGASPFH